MQQQLASGLSFGNFNKSDCTNVIFFLCVQDCTHHVIVFRCWIYWSCLVDVACKIVGEDHTSSYTKHFCTPHYRTKGLYTLTRDPFGFSGYGLSTAVIPVIVVVVFLIKNLICENVEKKTKQWKRRCNLMSCGVVGLFLKPFFWYNLATLFRTLSFQLFNHATSNI